MLAGLFVWPLPAAPCPGRFLQGSEVVDFPRMIGVSGLGGIGRRWGRSGLFRRGGLVARGRIVRHCIAVLAPVRIGCLSVLLRLLHRGSETVTVRMDAGPRAVWVRGPVAAMVKVGIGLLGIESLLAVGGCRKRHRSLPFDSLSPTSLPAGGGLLRHPPVGRRGISHVGPVGGAVLVARSRGSGCSGLGPPVASGTRVVAPIVGIAGFIPGSQDQEGYNQDCQEADDARFGNHIG